MPGLGNEAAAADIDLLPAGTVVGVEQAGAGPAPTAVTLELFARGGTTAHSFSTISAFVNRVAVVPTQATAARARHPWVSEGPMRYLHTMIRVLDLDAALRFFALLGLRETRRRDSEQGRFTLVFLSTGAPGDSAEVELTHNWDQTEPYGGGRNFGHLAYEVDDIHALCASLQAAGVTIARPPRDGRMAFVRSPDGISIELLQRGGALPVSEPWTSMPNVGTW